MMLDNPEMIQAAIRSNPQMRELMDSNPEIGHMINNPQLMRQALEMTRNPSMMQVERFRTSNPFFKIILYSRK